ncbi:MAG: hypothetical protein OEY75_08465 [Hylemonella sp.]|nr:hypothetical protein [Hylemonella sp.]MDH5709135.1 hypothetical protein [Hylemonella sp.]
MSLDYLVFDYSEDEHGHGCFEAMASVPAKRLPALHAEITELLGWAFDAFAGLRAPLEEGGEWDYLLEGRQEWSVAETLSYDEGTGRIMCQPGAAGEPLHTLTLAVSGSAQFCAALSARFELDEGAA